MTILEAIHRGPLLVDGAMGTQLQQAGLPPGDCGDLWNLDRPETVARIHQTYLDAGARILTTNTFGANRLGLARYDAQDRVVAINRAGAALARQAAGAAAWVLGDIGPFGGFIAPLGEYDAQEIFEVFAEQAAALHSGGVDGMIVETMSALEEVALAVQAAHNAGAALVVATMAFDHTRVGPRTMMGATPEQAAAALVEAGAAIIGANCGASLNIDDYLEIVRRMRLAAPGVPIIVQPNAGQPELRESGAIIYPSEPAQFAEDVERLVAAGASIAGGCCGTTPAHISALAQVVVTGAMPDARPITLR